MKTVILGCGLLGSELVRKSGWDLLSRDFHDIDITKPETYRDILKQYEQIVNCIGYTNTWDTKKEPTWSVNYVGVMDLVDYCNNYNKKLVQISTDYIYTNSKKNVNESDVPVHFDNWYTYTKLLADGYVQARCKKYLLVRTSFKPKPFPWKEGWSNLKGNFDYVDVIADLIIELINKRAKGVYNVGTEEKTMYELAVRTKPDCVEIDNTSQPHNITMDLTKMKNTLND